MAITIGDTLKCVVLSNDNNDIGYYPKKDKGMFLLPGESITLSRKYISGWSDDYIGFHFQYFVMNSPLIIFDEGVQDSIINYEKIERLYGYNFE